MSYDSIVYEVVKQVPRGRVTTYKLIAAAVGVPGSSRAVGNALGRNCDPDAVPCYRVVRSDGGVGGFRWGVEEKVRRLRRDGIVVECGRVVDMSSVVYVPGHVRRL